MSTNSSKVKADKFAAVAKRDVVDKLEKLASVVLLAMKRGYKPTDLVGHLGQWFKGSYVELNPLYDLDNYGMEQILAKTADPEELKRAKSYYKSLLDAWINSKAKHVTEAPMKLTVGQLKHTIRETVLREKLKENMATDLLPGSEGKLAAYSKKVEDFLDGITTQAEELALEGEELMKADYTRQNPSVGERNRFFLQLIGYLRKLRSNVAMSMTDLRKMLG